jgi:hypothetical protein
MNIRKRNLDIHASLRDVVKVAKISRHPAEWNTRAVGCHKKSRCFCAAAFLI